MPFVHPYSEMGLFLFHDKYSTPNDSNFSALLIFTIYINYAEHYSSYRFNFHPARTCAYQVSYNVNIIIWPIIMKKVTFPVMNRFDTTTLFIKS